MSTSGHIVFVAYHTNKRPDPKARPSELGKDCVYRCSALAHLASARREQSLSVCDYYLLIIGGRYGSTTAEGISYTEKEYDYAVSLGLKVIALIHGNPDDIPFGKSEKEPQLQERLQQFREKVSTNRLVKYWKTAEALPGLVAQSLANAMKMFPAVGWVRANKAASEDLLREINDLRKINTQLAVEVAEFRRQPVIKDLAGLEDKIEIRGKYYHKWHRSQQSWTLD